MSPEATAALFTALATILSAIIARYVARETAAKEIEKMKMQWEREDVVSSEEEFAEMASAVSVYMRSFEPKTKAISAVAALRTKERGELAVLLDKLYIDLTTEGTPFPKIELDLSKVIEEKRKRARPKM